MLHNLHFFKLSGIRILARKNRMHGLDTNRLMPQISFRIYIKQLWIRANYKFAFSVFLEDNLFVDKLFFTLCNCLLWLHFWWMGGENGDVSSDTMFSYSSTFLWISLLKLEFSLSYLFTVVHNLLLKTILIKHFGCIFLIG